MPSNSSPIQRSAVLSTDRRHRPRPEFLRILPGVSLFVLFLVLLSGQRVAAATGGPDAGGYTYIDSAEATLTPDFEDISATGTVAATASGADDGTEVIPIGFTFSYYGNPYTNVNVCSNGFLAFNETSGAFTDSALPNVGVPNNMIAGWWDDLGPINNGTIYYETLGVAPNRRFIVQFQGVEELTLPANLNTFQFKLFESSNQIEVHYETLANSAGDSATIGIENSSGTVGLTYFSASGIPPISTPFAIRYGIPGPPITVTNTNDMGPGSLRQAIADAGPGGVINFNSALDGLTILLNGSQLSIDKSLTIDASSLDGGITISGNNTSRVLGVQAGANVALNNLTITLGNASGGNGGGIENRGTLELTDCTLSKNTTSGRGGGIANDPNTGNLIFTRGSILSNTADLGGGISSLGGAIPNLANGIELRNVTIAGNSSTGGSGGGVFHQLSFVRLYSCTITGNTAGSSSGGGLHRNNSGDLHLENTIIANNDATSSANDDLSAVVTTRAGVNFIGDPTGASGIGVLNVDYLTGDPLFVPLGGYGGPTQTMPPGPGSPVIDAGGASDPGGTDQRGAPRFFNGALDIGAVEYLPAVVDTLVDELNVNPGSGLSLREAIALPFVSTITFGPGMDAGPCVLTNGLLLVDKSLIIDASSLARGFTISGADTYRIFEVTAGNTVSMDSLTLTEARSTFAQDQGAAIYNAGTLTVRRSTFHRNRADRYGGALGNSGALTLIGCTIANNTAASDSGGINHRSGTLILQNCTVAGNSSGGSGGAMYVGGNLSLTNTILAKNTAATSGPEITNAGGTITPTGVNIVGNLASSGLAAGPSILAVDPHLSPLGYHGGPNQTMHPLISSPAIDPAGGDISTSEATDQRGFARVVDGGRVTAGAIVDIGAVEAGPVLEVTNPGDNAAGTLRAILNSISGNPGVGHHVVFRSGNFPATITPVSELTLISTEVFIDGSDIGGTGVQISGGGVRGIFNVSPTGVAGMHSLTLRDGRKSSSAAVMVSGTLTLGNCTVANNVTTSSGGAIDLLFTTSRAVLDHCTLSGNNANGGSASDAGAIQSSGTLRLTHSTVSNNTALNSGQPGGIFVFDGTLTVENSIVAGNTSGSIPDLEKNPAAPDIITRGVNLVGDLTGSGLTSGSALLTGNALLGPLGDYGGPTFTMTPLEGSPAIDAAVTSIVAADQRGVPRPVGSANDLGAVEAVVLTGLAPSNGATLLSILPTLTWATPVEATQNELFIGTNPDNLISQGVLSSPFVPSGILAGQTYYWRIESTVGSGLARSELRSFTTRSSLVVTTEVDENDGGLTQGVGDSLRETIADAVPGERITFDPSLSGKTITLAGSQLVINKNLSIDASDLDLGIAIDANGTVTGQRVFTISASATVTMDALTIRGGKPGTTGGCISNAGNLSMNRCSILDGEATTGGGLHLSGTATAALTNCTISGCHATDRGGAIYVLSSSNVLTLVNCTISGNSAATIGGGLRLNASPVLNIENSIVAGNTATSEIEIANNAGTINPTGVNLIENSSNVAVFFPAPAILGVDPMLSPLGYYGGPTQTMHPLVGSPVIDPVGSTNHGGTDQRGFARLAGATVDIGAVEIGPVALVTNPGDSAVTAGTLRNAMTNAVVPGTVIRFGASFDGEPGDVIDTASVLSLSAGQAIFLDASDRSGGVTVAGTGSSRLFTVNSGSALAGHSLTVTGGDSGTDAGGLFNDGGSLTLNNSKVTNNTGHVGGGILCVNGLLILTNTTVSGNHGTFQTGGLHQDGSRATLTGCTFSGNATDNNGGAIYATGGGVCRIVQCTFSDNEAGTVGGGSGGALMTYAGAQVHLLHSTIANNSASGAGGGIQVSTGQGVTVTLDHCIVADNTVTPATASDINGDYTAKNVNLVVSHPDGTRSGTIPLATDPLLSPLGDWGGLTQTIFLGLGSPAIDAGAAAASPPLTDQRGRVRVNDGDNDTVATIDLGAYEVGTTTVTSAAGSGSDTLREIIESSPGHEWIFFDGGVFDGSPGARVDLGSEIEVKGNVLHIDASDTALGVTLDGNDATRILNIDANSAVEIDKVNFTGGFTGSGEHGAGILSAGDLVARNSVFSSNNAGGSGGGLEVTGSLIAEDLVFDGNSATEHGGGLRYNESGTLTLTGCSFANNSAGLSGGGARSNGSWAYTTGCTFSDNTAVGDGGALYSAGTTDVTDCEYLNNSSSGDGGGLWSADLVNIINSPFTNNAAGDNGGGIFSTAPVNLSDSDFAGNSAGGSGGGLWVQGGVTTTDSNISGNTATQEGGGIRNDSGTTTLTGSTVAGNRAGTSGGGVWSSGSTTLVNATIANNFSGQDGGGIRHTGGAISVTNATVSGNAASGSGGGMWSDGSVTLKNTIIAGNSAIDSNDLQGDVVGASDANLIGDGTGMTGLVDGVNSNQVGTGSLPIDARLSSLGDYGGATPTMQLLVGSPALDAGLNGGGIPANGQRGFARVGAPDIGAQEAGPVLVVTNSGDIGAGSLRSALQAVTQPGTRIVFNLSTPTNPTMPPVSHQNVITLAGGQLIVSGSKNVFIDASVLVDGSGNPTLEDDPLRAGEMIVPRGVTVSGDDTFRVIRVSSGNTLAMHGVTVTRGKSSPGGNGGGILNQGTLTLTECAISDCEVTGTAGGGGLDNSGRATLIRSTLSGNQAESVGGGINSNGVLTILSSTVSGNTSNSEGGGVNAFGNARIHGSTISRNTGSSGGGLHAQGFQGIELVNTIIAGNTATSSSSVDLASVSTATRGGVNFVGDLSGSGLSADSTLLTGDPLLGVLADNGGPTKTIKLLPGSPAIDSGEPFGITPFTDQRGFSRIIAGGLDIGALETGSSDFSPSGLTLHAKVSEALGTGGTMRIQIGTGREFLKEVVTLAGDGVPGSTDGSLDSARFSFPSAVAEDSMRNLFVADPGSNKIRMITPQGVVSTVAGTGNFGLKDGDGLDEARFSFPSGVAVGPDDSVYVSDTLNHSIRKLTRPTLPGLQWTVSTVAGVGAPGFMDGAGTAAMFNHPHGLEVDGSGNIFVADSNNHRIRKITPLNVVSTYAGTGGMGALDHVQRLSAQFKFPFGVAVNTQGEVFVADRDNHRICRIEAPGTGEKVIALAGAGAPEFVGGVGQDPDSEEGPNPVEDPGMAQFNSPVSLALDADGNLLVADKENHAVRLLSKPVNVSDPWVVSTLAGTGVAGFKDDLATADGAQFHCATGICVTASGDVIIADEQNQRIRRIAADLFVEALPGTQDAYGLNFSSVIDSAALRLVSETTYHFRWVASDGSTQMMGETFALFLIPTVVTTPMEAGDLTPTTATMNGLVNPHGSATTVTFTYSTEPDLSEPFVVGTLLDGDGDANLTDPRGLVVDSIGNVFVADRSGHRIVKITTGGVASTFAGSTAGVSGFVDQPGTAARFDSPVDLAIDSLDHLYVADELNHRIRKISPTGAVTTIAGNGVATFANAGNALDGSFVFPCGVATDAAGAKIYVADRGNNRIRIISGAGLDTLAGDGTAGFVEGSAPSARFNNPTGVAVDGTGNVYVADRDNHRVRAVLPGGQVVTVAGSAVAGFLDGNGALAQFSSPSAVAVDGNGNILVADRDNHRLRTINSLGVVSTKAGSGEAGFLDSDPAAHYPATATQFSSPHGVAVGPTGIIFLTEGGSDRVRSVTNEATTPTTAPQLTGDTSGDLPISALLPRTLIPGATYYFRINGVNAQGPAEGDILSFTTPTNPAIAVYDGDEITDPELASGQTTAVDYGSTPVNNDVTRQFTIANVGGYVLNVSSIVVAGEFQSAGAAGAIAPGATYTFDVVLDASSAGSPLQTLTIWSDDPGQDSFAFPLTGVVLDPPTVTTVAADNLVDDQATLNGTVNPEGSATTVWFEYSQDPELDGVVVSTIAATALNAPRGIVSDGAGNIYICDTDNHRIRRIAPDGTSSTFAGTGDPGFDNGPGTSAKFNEPVGVVIAPDGTLYVSDSRNHCIRAISPLGDVTTHSGLVGVPGFTDGVAGAARFNGPMGLALDSSGFLYVADRGNDRIRKVAPDGTVTPLADSGGQPPVVVAPEAVVVRGDGTLHVTAAGNDTILSFEPGGALTTFAGSGTPGSADGQGLAAQFDGPSGMALDDSGLLWVADSNNNRIRKVETDGTVSTIAGTDNAATNDGPGNVADFDGPVAVATGVGDELLVIELASSATRRLMPDTILTQAATNLDGFGDAAVTLPLTGLDVNATYYFRALATNGGGSEAGDILSFSLMPVASSPFAAWQNTHFGVDAENPLIAGPLADPSRDGVSNILKYALFLDPNTTTQAGTPVPGQDGGDFTLTYTRNTAATDLVFTVEWSVDLVSWSTVGVTAAPIDDFSDPPIIQASVPRGGDLTKYLRLNVNFLQP